MPLHTFKFGRQPKSDGLCLSDYVLDADEGKRDHSRMFVVTAGECVRSHSEEAKQRGEFLLAHALQALAIETAEGCAEWLHRRMREDWGFPDPPTMTMQERFTSRYRGKRYSFGYPACPNLEDQSRIVRAAEAGRNRREAHRRIHDGPGGERERAGVPPPRLRLFHAQASQTARPDDQARRGQSGVSALQAGFSDSTATACDCGYDLRVSWDDQPDSLREKPKAARSKIRGIGVFLICVAALAATAFWTRGVPDFLAGSGMFKDTVEAVLAWGATGLFCAVGLILLAISYIRRRAR